MATAFYAGKINEILCDYEEFDQDTPLSRTLKAAATTIVASQRLLQSDGNRAMAALHRMEGVGELQPDDLRTRPAHHSPTCGGPGAVTRRRATTVTVNRAVASTPTAAANHAMAARPKATILVVDPDDTGRWIEVRGDVEITQENAVEVADQLTRLYTRHDHYYGGIFPAEQQEQETRVVCRIRPIRVNLDAIHR